MFDFIVVLFFDGGCVILIRFILDFIFFVKFNVEFLFLCLCCYCFCILRSFFRSFVLNLLKRISIIFCVCNSMYRGLVREIEYLERF